MKWVFPEKRQESSPSFGRFHPILVHDRDYKSIQKRGNEAYKDDHHKKNQTEHDDKRNRNAVVKAVLIKLWGPDKKDGYKGDEKHKTDQGKNQPPQK